MKMIVISILDYLLKAHIVSMSCYAYYNSLITNNFFSD